jgi:hypothetical protein
MFYRKSEGGPGAGFQLARWRNGVQLAKIAADEWRGADEACLHYKWLSSVSQMPQMHYVCRQEAFLSCNDYDELH